MVITDSYVTIAGGTVGRPRFRVVKVNGDVSDELTREITLYSMALSVAGEIAATLGVPLILSTEQWNRS